MTNATLAISDSRAELSETLREMALACLRPSHSFLALSSVLQATVTETPALSNSTAVGLVTNPAPRRSTLLSSSSVNTIESAEVVTQKGDKLQDFTYLEEPDEAMMEFCIT
nr:hypothetical protein CFP56_77260 [Quercus suber]